MTWGGRGSGYETFGSGGNGPSYAGGGGVNFTTGSGDAAACPVPRGATRCSAAKETVLSERQAAAPIPLASTTAIHPNLTTISRS
jgi:hypothetical protein